MAIHGAARLRVAQRLERDAIQATRLLLGELTTTHLALLVEGIVAAADIDTPPCVLPIEAYMPAGRQAAQLLQAFAHRIEDLDKAAGQ